MIKKIFEKEKIKSFYGWFFRDYVTFPYPRISEGTRRIGLIFFTVVGGCAFVAFGWMTIFWLVVGDDDWLLTIAGFVASPVVTWVAYQLYRSAIWSLIWIFDGFTKSGK